MTKKKRIIALLMAATIAFVMLFSAFFIAANAKHDCTGEDCPICYEISICANILKTVSYGVIIAVIAKIFASHSYILPAVIKADAEYSNPVSLKVKLSN